MTAPIDSRALMAEIEAEARARRLRGDIPADFEAELDAKFLALSPKGSGNDFAAVMHRVELDALLDHHPPVQSAKRGGTVAKKGLAKLSSWYIRHLGEQVTRFALSITQAVRILGERVDALEASVGTSGHQGTTAISAALPPRAAVSGWDNEILAALKETVGRVLVANAGSGAFVRTLTNAGHDAYGIEPLDVEDHVLLDPGTEVRSAALPEHLKTIAGQELEAVVLTGISDALTVGGALEVLGRLRAVMKDGALLVIVSTDPEQWRRESNGVLADVTFGAPLAPATWRELLIAQGYRDIEVSSAEPTPIIEDLPGTDAATAALNGRLRALEAAIAVAPSHLILARRSA